MNWFRRFMFGRYGMDQLSIAMFLFALVLSYVTRIIQFNYLMIAVYAVFGLTYFRIFSRNISQRYQENMRFLSYWSPIQNFIVSRYKRLKDFRYHKYLKCPKCAATLRVPRKRGKICVTCPKCKNEFITKS